jgi:hypothetical protein
MVYAMLKSQWLDKSNRYRYLVLTSHMPLNLNVFFPVGVEVPSIQARHVVNVNVNKRATPHFDDYCLLRPQHNKTNLLAGAVAG